MLLRLSISNYALIDRLDLQPGAGLSIITGETGAGKSVMLGAMGLLKGERADSKVIADTKKKSIVEAAFVDLDSSVASKVRSIDPEWDGKELILRREILPSGRTRAFINDSPATLAQLSDIAGSLLDIHSQNSNSLLTGERMQLALVDSVAANRDVLARYDEEFRHYVTLRQKIKLLKEEAQKNKEQSEIIAFKLSQLEKLRPKRGELKKVENRYETLTNSEEIREKLGQARGRLMMEDRGALEGVEEAISALSNIDFSIFGEDSDIIGRLQQCAIELKDVAETLDSVHGDVEYDPATIASLSSRMQAYYSAFRTFRVDTDEELEVLYENIKRQYRSIEGDADTQQLESEAKALARTLRELGSEISAARSKAASVLQQEIESEARKLGLDNLRFEIKLTPVKLSRFGGDSVQFLAAFNKNQQPSPVGGMASGGEIARLMLAIKNITSSRLSLPTIIFDEIDTGVSGHIADRMGEMMMEMGSRMQILTITHLPQVAAKGSRHFKVYKEDRADRTVSDVMLLSRDERVEEIARMLSGEKVNDAALHNARSLLND